MLKTPIPIETVLSDAELAIYRVMSVRGGVAARYTLRQELIDTGKVQEITLHTCLDSSPIFTCINRGVFALRGTNISPEWLVTECKAVGGDAFRAPVTSEISKPADTEGYSTFCITFTKYMFDSKIWAVPAPIKRIMEERDYQVEGFDSPATFTEVSGGKKRLNNFINKLTKKGIKAGDHVLVHINPERHHIWFEKASPEDATIK